MHKQIDAKKTYNIPRTYRLYFKEFIEVERLSYHETCEITEYRNEAALLDLLENSRLFASKELQPGSSL